MRGEPTRDGLETATQQELMSTSVEHPLLRVRQQLGPPIVGLGPDRTVVGRVHDQRGVRPSITPASSTSSRIVGSESSDHIVPPRAPRVWRVKSRTTAGGYPRAIPTGYDTAGSATFASPTAARRLIDTGRVPIRR